MKIYCLFALMLVSLPAMGQPGVVVRFNSVQVSHLELKATKPEGRVAELIAKLASDSAEERRAAAQALEKMGPAIEPQVRWAWQHEEPPPRDLFPFVESTRSFDRTMDPKLLQPYHAFHELQVVLSHLEEQRLNQTSLVTLHYTNDLLTNMLADFGRQVSAEIHLGTMDIINPSLDWTRTNRVSIEINRATYWEALERIKLAAGLEEERTISRVRPPPWLALARTSLWLHPFPTGKFVVSGPFKLALASPEMARPGDGPISARSKLNLVIQAEPKLSDLGTNALVQVDECVDDTGKSLIETKTPTFEAVMMRQYSTWDVPIQLQPTGGNRIGCETKFFL